MGSLQAALSLWALTAFSSLFVAAPVLGQGAPAGPLAPQPGVRPESAPPTKQAIRVRVSQVIAPVTVRDRTGEMVLNLAQKDFHIFDNGAEQKIERFDLGGDPLSVVLVVETSSRIEAMLPAILKTGIVFTQTVMGQTAEAAVVGFDDSVNLLEEFSTDPERIERAIGRLRVGTSGSRLYDAMARGVLLLGERPAPRRRIMVVVAEAQDQESETKLGEVLRKAQLANVTIYSVGLSTAAAALRAKPNPPAPVHVGPPGAPTVPTTEGNPQIPEIEREMQMSIDLLALAEWLVKTGLNALGPNSLEVASKATGGLHLNTMKDRSIEKAIDEIGGELHAQYTLSYRLSGDEPSGYHEIKIEVDRPGVSVRTRPGYYIPPPES